MKKKTELESLLDWIDKNTNIYDDTATKIIEKIQSMIKDKDGNK